MGWAAMKKSAGAGLGAMTNPVRALIIKILNDQLGGMMEMDIDKIKIDMLSMRATLEGAPRPPMHTAF